MQTLVCRYLNLLISTVFLTTILAQSMPETPIRHRLAFKAAENHYLDVETIFPAGGRDRIEIMMAVWTPGSYLVREFSRHIQDLEVFGAGARALTANKIRKNRWSVETAGEPEIRVKYRLYCREMSVRTNWVSKDFALLNGAATFLTIVGEPERPHSVRLELPGHWEHSLTGLPPHPDRDAHHYVAKDFDELVDTPILIGNPKVHEFEVAGREHLLANQGGGQIWDQERSRRDVKKIVEEAYRFWGHLPYQNYVFLNLITEARGGLEHRNSTVMMTSRWNSRIPKDYRSWLSLVSHEFFHTWNIKRLRPIDLGPFNYEEEVYTTDLWVAEGITSYYDDLLLVRAGLYSQENYLEALSEQIKKLQSVPGRLTHPLSMSSFDAWVKLYRPDENSINSTISYYTKGAVVAFLLDAEIRIATQSRRNLDDVMRLAYQRYSGDRGYRPEEFRGLVSEVAGTDLSAWLATALDSTQELDYERALEWFGLRFKETDPESDDGGEQEPKGAWLGAVMKDENGRLIVSEISGSSPAFEAGLNVGDEILAIDDYRVPVGDLTERLKQYQGGQRVIFLVSRRERLQELPVRLGHPQAQKWALEVSAGATASQATRLAGWVSGSQSGECCPN